jgi:hypothetical protein
MEMQKARFVSVKINGRSGVFGENKKWAVSSKIWELLPQVFLKGAFYCLP